jgi:threonylcarbamoyladenosine tRNA methylthiotransferase MtaB
VSRLRLGSLQPPEITAGIIDLLVDENSCVCEHLHLSLQSLVDRVLEAMGRQYRQRQVIALVEAIKRRHPRVTLGADLIVGFPAAGRDDFRDTCRLLADLPLDYLHVFPYSPRPGTKAAGWPAAAGDGEIRERVAAIQELGAAMRERCYAANVGVEHEVLLEKPVAAAGKEPVWTGHSRNYLQVRVALSSPEARVLRAGDCCRVTTTGAEPGRWLRAKK